MHRLILVALFAFAALGSSLLNVHAAKPIGERQVTEAIQVADVLLAEHRIVNLTDREIESWVITKCAKALQGLPLAYTANLAPVRLVSSYRCRLFSSYAFAKRPDQIQPTIRLNSTEASTLDPISRE